MLSCFSLQLIPRYSNWCPPITNACLPTNGQFKTTCLPLVVKRTLKLMKIGCTAVQSMFLTTVVYH